MCSSASPSSLFLPTSARLLFRRSCVSPISSCHPILITRRSVGPGPRLCASIAEGNLDVSWFSPELTAVDDYGGWAFVEAPTPNRKKGLPSFLLVGIGTSIAALLAVIAHFALSKRGLALKISSLHGILRPSVADKATESENPDYDASTTDAVVPEASLESEYNGAVETVVVETNHHKRQEGKLGRIVIPVAADSTQQEALLLLKKLKIIEDDVKADELCSRREYARWLVRANSVLERNSKHRIVPSVVLSGSILAAFDDVSVGDPDFEPIQSLAESGMTLSKLSGYDSGLDLNDFKSQEGVYFFPERFVSRQDLIDWKSQLEYEVMPGIHKKISRTNTIFMDSREISLDASPQLFMDMLAGDKSILKKVFGQGKRFQPNKPSTKAQAAVALTSGKMTEAIHAELSRLEAENVSRRDAMEEIRLELLSRGDIQRYWDAKLDEEKNRAFEAESLYLTAIHDLKQEMIVQENTLKQYLKERAAMDCQKQLLSSLKEEVREMSERLIHEKVEHADERRNVHGMLTDLQIELEKKLDAKSILEAEIEALRILRSWIEDEARRSHARTKVLGEVARRWKWVDGA